MLRELQLIVVLEAILQVVAPIRLLLLDELAQCQADQTRYVVFVLRQKILKALRSDLQ